MRKLFKMGTPRGLQQFKTDLEGVVSAVLSAWIALANRWTNLWRFGRFTALDFTPTANPWRLRMAA
jgi:hypothetical protein